MILSLPAAIRLQGACLSIARYFLSCFVLATLTKLFRKKAQVTGVKWPSQHQNVKKGAKIGNCQIGAILLISMWLTRLGGGSASPAGVQPLCCAAQVAGCRGKSDYSIFN